MARWEDLAVAAAVLSPWVGIIILLIVHSHIVDRVVVLEREALALNEKINALTKELGWKEK